MNEKFIADRITELRLKKNVSEHKMSLELGQSRSYIQGISSGKAMPSFKQFLNICSYFEITPAEFFDPEANDPQKLHQFTNLAKQLDNEDMDRVMDLMNRLIK